MPADSDYVHIYEGTMSSRHESELGEGEDGLLSQSSDLYLRSTSRSPLLMQDRGPAYGLQFSITEPVLSQALNLFLSDTVIYAPCGSMSKGHFVNLTDLVQSSSKLEALPLALESVALASFANRFGISGIRLEATRRYAIAVHQLRNTNLGSESNASSLMACIQLLSIYEVHSAMFDPLV